MVVVVVHMLNSVAFSGDLLEDDALKHFLQYGGLAYC